MIFYGIYGIFKVFLYVWYLLLCVRIFIVILLSVIVMILFYIKWNWGTEKLVNLDREVFNRVRIWFKGIGC